MEKEEIEYFDIHSHLHSNFFKDDVQSVIKEMKEKKIWTISVGVDFNDSKKAVDLSNKNENIFATIGWHPVDNKDEEFIEDDFQNLLDENKNKIVGIGECGLDYYWPMNDLKNGKINKTDFIVEVERQKELFKKQIYFAVKNDLPLMLHVRSFKDADAHKDTFEILDEIQKKFNKKIVANFHFFTEDSRVVNEIVKRGHTISLPGVITFVDLNESIKKIPLDKIMVETDSPFAAPKPFRGKTNTPLYVEEMVKKIAEVKNIDFYEVKNQVIKNSLKFWKI